MHLSGPDGPVDDACDHKCPPPAPSHGRGIFIITRLPGVTLRSPPAVYWPPFQGLRMLWISQPYGLGHISPHAVGAVE